MRSDAGISLRSPRAEEGYGRTVENRSAPGRCRMADAAGKSVGSGIAMSSQPHVDSHGADGDPSGVADTQDASAQLLGIWARQIETARSQSEDAIVALTARFSAIVQRIDAALGASGTDSRSRERAAEVRSNENDLRQVVDALKAIQLSRNQLVTEIRGLTSY